ncbi:hypothetical protein BKA70DRAFT_1097375 [Coprinopsis sp. MPI-PUGE-AT-0042]|nr:hypothetical protein BKA70DRAFT_1097375 [Coprinopsis sp. MPI-PUGE-AT-0042]
MGGSAFASILGNGAFPRLPPRIYQSVKARYLAKIGNLYTLVTVPIEAPEKETHGDLDILVAVPKSSLTIGGNTQALGSEPLSPFVAPSVVQAVLGATHLVACEGNRTSNFAVPIEVGEWAPLGYEAEEQVARKESEDGRIYYQVDVHPCSDESEFERIKFFHSYGDMGMILGLVARHIGLRLGLHGLKIPNPPHPIFDLSHDFDDILHFLGLSRETYDSGFKTKEEVFQWVSSMKWFDPRYFDGGSRPGKKKVKADRKMYAEFVQWVNDRRPTSLDVPPVSDQAISQATESELYRSVREEALKHFNKASEYNAAQTARETQQKVRSVFSGHQVRDWADLGEHWKGVKMIMDEVRKRMGGEGKVLEFYDERGEEALAALIRDVRDDLGIRPIDKPPAPDVTKLMTQLSLDRDHSS